MKKTYRVTSPEGAQWASNQLLRPVEEGEEVELETGRNGHEETALTAAGWLAEPKKKGTK